MWIEQSEIEKFFPALNLRVCHSQELFCPFPALLLVSPYKGVKSLALAMVPLTFILASAASFSYLFKNFVAPPLFKSVARKLGQS